MGEILRFKILSSSPGTMMTKEQERTVPEGSSHRLERGSPGNIVRLEERVVCSYATAAESRLSS